MSNELATRFSVKEVPADKGGFVYKVLDKRTEVCESPTLKAARQVRRALVLDALALEAGLDLVTG